MFAFETEVGLVVWMVVAMAVTTFVTQMRKGQR